MRAHAPALPVHDVILNGSAIPEPLRRRYAAERAHPIGAETDAFSALGCRAWAGDMLCEGPKIRHDSDKLAQAVLHLAAQPRPSGEARP